MLTHPTRRVVTAAAAGVVAITLVAITGGLGYFLLFASLGCLAGLWQAHAARGESKVVERLRLLGGFNAMAALGCALLGPDYVASSLPLSLACYATAMVIAGGLVRWVFRSPQTVA